MDSESTEVAAAHPAWTTAAAAAAMAVLYIATSIASIRLTTETNGVAFLWVSNALAATLAMRRPPREHALYFALVAVSTVVVNYVGGRPAPAALLLFYVLANATEVAVAVAAMRRMLPAGLPPRADVLPLLVVTLATAVIGPLAGGAIAAAGADILGLAPFAAVFWTWWSGSAAASVVVVPLALFLPIARADLLLRPRPLLTFLAVALATLGYAAGVMAQADFPFVLIILPLMVAAVMLTPARMALLSSAVAAFLIGAALAGWMKAVGNRSEVFSSGVHIAAAIAVFLPLCASIMIERMRRDRRALAMSAEQLRRAFDESAIAASMATSDGRLIRTNAAYRALVGRTAEELAGLHFLAITHPDDRDVDRRAVDEALAAGRNTYRFEKRFLRKDGSDVWVRLSASLIRDEATGAPLYSVCQIEDIDQQKRAEDELDRIRNRWNFALESARQGVWDADVKAGTCYHSPIWRAMLGLTEEDDCSDGRFWLELIHPDDREAAECADVAHREGRTPHFEATFRMRHRDGHWVWILDRGRIIERDAAGNPTRMVGTHTDISPQKEAEEKLAALHERMRLATEAGGVGLWSARLDTGELFWDERMLALYGIGPEEFSGRHEDWTKRVHPEDLPRAQAELETALRLGQRYNSVYRIVRPDGEIRYVRALAMEHRAADGTVTVIGTNWDVTEHRLVSMALADEKERLRVTLHSIGDAVISTDTEGRITFMNLAAETLTGHVEPLVLGAPLDAVYRPVHEDTGEILPSSVAEALAAGAAVEQQHPGKLVRADGTVRSIRDTAAPVRTADGKVIGAVLVFQDVTNARALQRDLAYAASHDSLTGLKNRAAFEGALQIAYAEARALQQVHAVLFIDLDRFKMLNDTAGHAAGDALLRDVAAVIRGSVRSRDVVARLGGDEFAILLHHCRVEDAEQVGAKIIEAVSQLRFMWGGKVYGVGASIGATTLDARSVSIGDTLAQADVACYAAKSGGRDRVAVYRPDSSEAHRHLSDLRIAAGIREAIEADRFRLYAQEIRALESPLARGRKLEILTRMVGPDGQIVPPGVFIPAAERFDLMGALDRWVLRTALGDFGARVASVPDLQIAVNLSANSLNDPSLWPFLSGELAATGFDPSRLVLEITETSVINNFGAAERFVEAARAAGCRVSLDDFGSGVSSFAYLKRFRVDTIKIDGAFVRNMTNSRYDRTIVRLIHEVGAELGVDTVAEFIEDTETVDLLRQIGVRYGQGYLFHRPRPLEEVLDDYGAAPRLSRHARAG